MVTKKMAKFMLAILGVLIVVPVFASGDKSAGAVASEVVQSFSNIAKLITAGAYIGGLAFSVGAIMKFKQHKDNPTQIPIGTPIALVFIGAALLFLPSILGTAGQTLFGGAQQTAGPSGSAWTAGGGS